jgi:hypothetical protein
MSTAALRRRLDRLQPPERVDIIVELLPIERDEHGNWPDPLPDPRIYVAFDDDPRPPRGGTPPVER